MKEICFDDLHDLALAVFKDEAAEEAFAEAIKREHEKVQELFDDLVSGREDFFIQKDPPSEQGRSIIRTWTRSEKQGMVVRTTHWLCFDNEDRVELLSDGHSSTTEQMMQDQHQPDCGIVRGRLWKETKTLPEEAWL